MSTQGRIDSLKARHDDLEAEIRDEDARPAPDAGRLRTLKVGKLHVKEELNRFTAD